MLIVPLAAAAHNAGSKRMVLTSSLAVYGDVGGRRLANRHFHHQFHLTHFWAYINKAGRMLGYEPRFSLEQGILEKAEWLSCLAKCREEVAAGL